MSWSYPVNRPAQLRCSFIAEPLEERVLLSIITVTNTNDEGPGSLRDAIISARLSAEGDTINFAIGSDANAHRVISLKSALPVVPGLTVINGYTQPGSRPNTLADGSNAQIRIHIFRVHEAYVLNAMYVEGQYSEVRGLNFAGFNSALILDGGGGHVAAGNTFGFDTSGKPIIGSNDHALALNSDENTVGGTTPAARNVIAGAGTGLLISSSFNTIVGNLIGTDMTGRAKAPNETGIYVQVGRENIIGGTTPAHRNVISGNKEHGILFRSTADGNRIIGNYIGVGVGLEGLGNGGNGIRIADGNKNQIGGVGSGEANVIHFNGRSGVSVWKGNGNTIRGNSINANGGLGIDLVSDFAGDFRQSEPDGFVTQNDTFDVDPGGGNRFQNFPVILSALGIPGSADVVARGKLQSEPEKTYIVDFYSSPTADSPSGHGEGWSHAGAITVTTDREGNVEFELRLTPQAPYISMTATQVATGDTSEFSGAVPVNNRTFIVRSTNATGPGSLDQAIRDANNQPGHDTIHFDIPGTGVKEITPTQPLPPVNDKTTIDGTTQPGAAPNTLEVGSNAVIRIQFNWGNNPALPGLTFLPSAAGSSLRGISFVNFAADAIAITGTDGAAAAEGVTVQGSFIGVAADGMTPGPIGDSGVVILNSSRNIVGGPSPADRNVIAGFDGFGVIVTCGPGGVATFNTISNNYIGTNAAGMAPVGRGTGGVLLQNSGAAFNLLDDNLLSGSEANVIMVTGATRNLVTSNNLGGNASGTAALGAGRANVFLLDAPRNWIGMPGAGNVIVGAGTLAPAWGHGIHIEAQDPARPSLAANNIIQGNFIGAPPGGPLRLPNSGAGIFLWNASRPVVGGLEDGAGNFISGNGGAGIEFGTGDLPPQTAVQGLPTPTFSGTIVYGNTLSDNGGDGITIRSGAAVAIRANSIFSNGGLGIDLGPDGVTPNDPGDPDIGANSLLNFPTIDSAVPGASGLTVSGVLVTTANTRYWIDFYSSAAADPSGYGEGATHLGSVEVTTGADGRAPFYATLPAVQAEHRVVTATATATSFGNTSEFSPSVTIQAPQPRVTDVFVRGSAWKQSFLDALALAGPGHSATAGYRIPSPAGALPPLLPWLNVNQVVVAFDLPVNVDASSLRVRGVRSNYAVTSVAPLPGMANAYVFTLDGRLGHSATSASNGDRLGIELEGDAPDGIRGPAGTLLDGAADGAAGGAAGGDFTALLNILIGDVTRNGTVGAADVIVTRGRQGGSLDEFPRQYSVFHDLDGNGVINVRDTWTARAARGHAVPTGVTAVSSADSVLLLARTRPPIRDRLATMLLA